MIFVSTWIQHCTESPNINNKERKEVRCLRIREERSHIPDDIIPKNSNTFPSPMHESEKWKWSRSVVSDS